MSVMQKNSWGWKSLALLAMFLLMGCGSEAPPSVTRITPSPIKVVIDSAPARETAQEDAEFEFSCDSRHECTFYCQLDEEPHRICHSPVEFKRLEEGAHRFEVWAVDAMEVKSESAVWEWVVDRRAPEIVDLAGPEEVTSEIAARFTFGCDKSECTFECSLAGRAIERCESGVTYHGLFDGDYLFAVRAQDHLGNVGVTKNWRWRVDSTPPEVVDFVGPSERTGETRARFEFECSEEGCVFECSLNSGDWESCESGVVYEDLPDGGHLFEVQATDLAGLTSEIVSWGWEIDTDLPAVVDLSGPVNPTNEVLARFEFECSKDVCRFECALEVEGDDEEVSSLQDCESGVDFEELEDGVYTFSVIPFDEVENQGSTASWTWRVDTVAPEVEFIKGPGAQIYEDRGVLEFGCDGEKACQFECQLIVDGEDEDDFEVCQSPMDLSELATGAYRFVVRATDLAGNPGDGEWAWEVLPLDWAKIAGGSEHSCGILEDGTLWCWGGNRRGQLGTGDTNDRERPARVGEAQDWIAIDAGSEHTCGIREGGSLWCWGNNGTGRLGDGTRDVRREPVEIGEDEAIWTAVSAGTVHTCGVQEDGSLWCWGDNYYGQLGDNSGAIYNEPTQVAGAQVWESVSAGDDGFTCAVTQDGELWCWGRNNEGQLGNGSTQGRTSPWRVGVDSDWAQVKAGNAHSCGLRDDGTLWCWGKNAKGAIGDGTVEDRHLPTLVDDDLRWQSFTAGRNHSCGVDDDGEVWCWGEIDGGISPLRGVSPTSLEVDVKWSQIGGQGAHSCGIREDLSAWCFGQNTEKQLGDGTRGFGQDPVRVRRP